MRNLYLIATMLAIAAPLFGCASPPPQPSQETQHLTHHFVFQKDDSKKRLGKFPTYVLMSKTPKEEWKIAAISNKFIIPSASNQEELLISMDYTNAVPAWNEMHADCEIDPVTGDHTNCLFSGGGDNNKANAYGPAHSLFTYPVALIGKNTIPILNAPRGAARYYKLSLSSMGIAIDQTHAIESAKEFNDGIVKFPAIAPKIIPYRTEKQVWEMQPINTGEKGIFYFVPNKFFTKDNDIIDAGSSVYVKWVKGLMTNENTKISDFAGYRYYAAKPFNPNDFNCMGIALFFSDGKYEKGRFCGYHYDMNYPIHAISPTLGDVALTSAEGYKYSEDGKPIYSYGPFLARISLHRISFSASEYRVVRILSPTESSKFLSKVTSK